ncbi:MAG: amino acid ABC transporter permease [Clostridiales Family XIII bacterium]|jgi:L-cystine transport system permease protein|nr:amino acid ABC transporter permease [Clostridiales Family XIII bacterium]
MSTVFDFDFFIECLKSGAARIPVNLYVAAASVFFGMIFGLIIALIRVFRVPVLSPIFRWLVTILKGVPVILMLLVFYVLAADYFNLIMEYFGIDYTFRQLNKAIIAIIALSVLSSIGLSESFRGALASVKKGQYDAAYSVWLTKRQALVYVIIPQAFPIAVPTLCNYIIGMIKAGALAAMISVVDIMNGALIPANANYRYLEGYTAAALIYWVVCATLEKVLNIAEKRFASKVREVA